MRIGKNGTPSGRVGKDIVAPDLRPVQEEALIGCKAVDLLIALALLGAFERFIGDA